VLVPRPGQSIEAAEIIAFVRERIADFKVPQYISIRRELLPRNPGGKAAKPSACPSAWRNKIWIDRCLPGNVLLSRLLLLSFVELGFDTEAYSSVLTRASAHADPDQIV